MNPIIPHTTLVSGDILKNNSALSRGFQQGESWALELVYRHYGPLVLSIARRGFSGFDGYRDPSDQEDLLQSVFAEAFENRCRSRYDSKKAYSSFLCGIARNKVRQSLTRRKRHLRTDAPPPGNPSEVDPETAVIEAEQHCRVAAFRESLTSEFDRVVLERHFVEAVSEERLACELGVTRYRVRKSVQFLRRGLAEAVADKASQQIAE